MIYHFFAIFQKQRIYVNQVHFYFMSSIKEIDKFDRDVTHNINKMNKIKSKTFLDLNHGKIIFLVSLPLVALTKSRKTFSPCADLKNRLTIFSCC